MTESSYVRVPRPVHTSRVLLWILGSFWGVLAVASIIGPHSLSNSAVFAVVAVMALNAVTLFWLGARIVSLDRGTLRLTLAVLSVNALLSVADEFGFFDLVSLVLALASLVLLLASRSSFTA